MSSASSAEATATGAVDVVAARGAGTIVVGLGNPLLGDDGIGWRIVEAARDRVAGSAAGASAAGAVSAAGAASAAPAAPGQAVDGPVQFECLAVGGLALMERLVGFRRAVLVDALLTGRDPAGTVRRLGLADLPDREASHLDSAHDASLAVALAAGRAMGAVLPDAIEIVAVEAVQVHEFSEELTPAVAAALPKAIELVLALLGGDVWPTAPGTAATAGGA